MQLAMSDSLKNFSLRLARNVVEENHAGKLIYAGGDDVLALLPLDHLFPAMRELYEQFRGRQNGFETIDGEILRVMGGVVPSDYGLSFGGMSASMGVVVVHHSYPLYHALQQAQGGVEEKGEKRIGPRRFRHTPAPAVR